MRTTLSKNWNPMTDIFQLTKNNIESQVLSDLSVYRVNYAKKYGKPAPSPIDVDNFVQEMWGFNVVFETVDSDSDDKETLGFLRPETQEVVINDKCINERRISFTIAHEAGHLSLHGPLFEIKNDLIVGWKNGIDPNNVNSKKGGVAETRREWQANVYAGSILAPEFEVQDFLKELGLIKDNILKPFVLDNYIEKFQQRFGLSKQALKIRLEHLKYQ